MGALDDKHIIPPTSVAHCVSLQLLTQTLPYAQHHLPSQLVDAPRFLWRGVLLDAGRHFFPVPFILKLLDLLALYKMNRFHWHLTEDQVGFKEGKVHQGFGSG